jgi:hypothetical protein
MSDNKNNSGGIGTAGLLGVAFVILKLCHVINWSWWWVTTPFWAPFAILAAAGIVILFVIVLLKGLVGILGK